MSPMVRRPPMIELALLGFLRNGPQHGYHIHQLLSDPDGLGQIWHLKQSQLYALLAKLEEDGCIIGELEAQVAAHPPRRMFHLTSKGQAAFLDWLQTPVGAPRLMRQEFIVKFYFARQEGEDLANRLIAAQQAACLGWLESMQAEKIDPLSFIWQLHQYRIGQVSAMLAWLQKLQQN